MINYQYINKFWEDSVNKQYLIETADHSIQITNQNLHSQTITITESLTSNSGGGLSFGDCEASCIKFRITRDNAPLVNKWLNVYVTMDGTNNTPFRFGRYKVISDKPVDGNRYREIVAYDKIYFVMNRDCTRWYKRMFREHTSMTIKQFRDAFFERFNITQKTVTLINDSVTINKAKVSKLSGRDIIKVIGEINGVFGHLGRDGEFNWISLDSTNPYPISRSYVIGLEYEDYNAAQMERIEILKADGSLAVYAGASEDDTEDQNTYVVESNFILASINNMDVMQNIADNLYLKTDLISFRPITDCELKGNPCIEVGDCISFTTSNTSIYTFVLQRTITGTQSLHDNIISEAGENYRQDYTTSTQAKIKDVQQTAAVSYVLDTEEYPADALPADGKVGDIAFKDVTASIGKVPLYTVEYNDKYSNMTDADYVRPSDYLDITNIEWDAENGGYTIEYMGMLKHVPDPKGPGYMFYNWNNGNPVFEVNIPEAGFYKWHTYVEYSMQSISGEIYLINALEILVGDGDPSQGYGVTVPEGPQNPPETILSSGRGVNIGLSQNTVLGEYSGKFEIKEQSSFWQNGKIYVYIYPHRGFPQDSHTGVSQMNVKLTGFYFEKIDPVTEEGDHGYVENFDRYIDGFYAKVKGSALTSVNSLNTRNRNAGDSNYPDEWKEIEFIQKVDTSENSGLSYTRPSTGAQKTLSLKSDVMRAWFKADPPQVKRTFNQYCVRYTGKPDNNIEITLQSNTGWLNKSIKQDSEGVFTIKSGGSVTSGAIEYCAYKITGLTNGKKYYFNLKVNFKDGTTFGNNYGKGLGLVFNTTGVIATDDWTGDPGTFNEDTLYYSMRRTTKGNFADFDFTATASTMYMCIVVADISGSQTSSLTLSQFVISQVERAYVRNFYIFDTVANDWLPYKPWGSGADDGGDGGASTIGDLDDVLLNNLIDKQYLVYDADTGQWVNETLELPIASSSVLGVIRVGANLSIDEETGILSAENTNTLAALVDTLISEVVINGQILRYDSEESKWRNVELTVAFSEIGDILINAQTLSDGQVLSYNAFSGKWINKSVGSATRLKNLGDVDIDETTLTDGQVLKWDDAEEKWVNGTGGGGSSDLEAIDLNQSQYNALTPAEKADLDKMYFITDGNGDGTINNWTISALAYKQLTPEQYEALSTAQKNDGTIYFVSDDATGVYGLKVIDITTTEYEQLTPEQKNNGIPYFVHD